MRWVQDFPLEARAASLFVESFKNVPDPVLFYTSSLSSNEEKIAWTLLGTVLFQGISYPSFDKLFSGLLEKFPGNKLWELPVPRGKELEQVVEETLGKTCWQLKEHFAGVFWSVGYFVRKHFPLTEWISTRTPKELWRDLGEIYFMGKKAYRPKANAAIYRLLSCTPYGLGFSTDLELDLPLPLTMGIRRYLAFMGPAKEENFSEMSQGSKQKMADDFFSAISKNAPIAAAHAFQFFLEYGKTKYLCCEYTDNCKKCPLQNYCKESEE